MPYEYFMDVEKKSIKYRMVFLHEDEKAVVCDLWVSTAVQVSCTCSIAQAMRPRPLIHSLRIVAESIPKGTCDEGDKAEYRNE